MSPCWNASRRLTRGNGPRFGASGKLYVVLAGSNQVSILNSDGTEAARFPTAPANLLQTIPYDAPATPAFDGTGGLLVTNHCFFTPDPDRWAVLDAYVNDTALPVIEPNLGGP